MSLRQHAFLMDSSGISSSMQTISIPRRGAWTLFCTAILVACNLSTGVAAGLPERPNIILVMTDEQGYGELACDGNPIIKTPHLDRLHRESLRFTDFHVSPTCAPTRTSLMTGRHEFRSGVTHTI